MQKSFQVKAFALKNIKLLVVLAIVILMSIACPDTFPTFANLSSLLQSMTIYGILACGMMFAAMTSGPDLSVGATACVAGMIAVNTIRANGATTGSVYLGFLLALLFAIAAGTIHGIAVCYLKSPSFLITLATQYLFFGIAEIGTQGRTISCITPAAFTCIGTEKLFGLPVSVYIFIAVAIVSYFLLHCTVFGRQVQTVGGNAKTSNLCGTKVKLVTVSSFIICSLAAAVGGMLLSINNQQATPDAGAGYEVNTMLCLIIGGVGFGQGTGTFPGVLYGIVVVTLLSNGMRLLGIESVYQTLIEGVLIIVAVAVEVYFRYRASGLKTVKKKQKS